MIKRFRMIAGPNGSGKSTLLGWLHDDYSVNFYTLLNADDILAHLLKTGAYSPKFPVSKEDLVRYAEATDYATASPEISKCRVANRHARGGHDVPGDKIDSRYFRSIGQLKAALPYLSRAYAFDNSGSEMIFLGEYEQGAGWQFAKSVDELPRWFVDAL